MYSTLSTYPTTTILVVLPARPPLLYLRYIECQVLYKGVSIDHNILQTRGLVRGPAHMLKPHTTQRRYFHTTLYTYNTIHHHIALSIASTAISLMRCVLCYMLYSLCSTSQQSPVAPAARCFWFWRGKSGGCKQIC